MSDTLAPPTADSFAPVGMSTGRIDPTSWSLPKAASEKVVRLHQRAKDLHAAAPPSTDIQELTEAKLAAERRIGELTAPRGAGGYNYDPSQPQVRFEQQKLDRAVAERARLEKLREKRFARWTVTAQLERAVTDWLARGIPGGNELVAVDDVPPAKLLMKGETAAGAVERYRRQLADLTDKLNQVRAAPYPSKLAIQRATEQIKAMATPPDCKSIINRLLPIGFAPMMLSSTIHGTERPALALSETINSAGLVAWLFEDQLIAKVTAEIKHAARDGEALDEKTRAAQETALIERMMDCERAECSLIWNMEISDETIIDFRRDTTPACLLGVRAVVVAPPVAPPETDVAHAYSIVGPGRR